MPEDTFEVEGEALAQMQPLLLLGAHIFQATASFPIFKCELIKSLHAAPTASLDVLAASFTCLVGMPSSAANH